MSNTNIYGLCANKYNNMYFGCIRMYVKAMYIFLQFSRQHLRRQCTRLSPLMSMLMRTLFALLRACFVYNFHYQPYSQATKLTIPSAASVTSIYFSRPRSCKHVRILITHKLCTYRVCVRCVYSTHMSLTHSRYEIAHVPKLEQQLELASVQNVCVCVLA